MAELYWFPFLVDKWLASRAIAAMTSAEEGAFIRLLAHAWGNGENPPSLPTNSIELGKLSRLGRRWGRSAARLLAQFTERDGRLYNRMLTKVWEKQRLSHDSAVRRGLLGASKRYGKKGSSASGSARKKPSANGSSASSPAIEGGVAELKQLELEEELLPDPYGSRVIASSDAGAVPAPKAPDALRETTNGKTLDELVPGTPSPIYDYAGLTREYLAWLDANAKAWSKDNLDEWQKIAADARSFLRIAPAPAVPGPVFSIMLRDRIRDQIQQKAGFPNADTWIKARIAELDAEP